MAPNAPPRQHPKRDDPCGARPAVGPVPGLQREYRDHSSSSPEARLEVGEVPPSCPGRGEESCREERTRCHRRQAVQGATQRCENRPAYTRRRGAGGRGHGGHGAGGDGIWSGAAAWTIIEYHYRNRVRQRRPLGASGGTRLQAGFRLSLPDISRIRCSVRGRKMAPGAPLSLRSNRCGRGGIRVLFFRSHPRVETIHARRHQGQTG
jgi:hypothetical protein